jgi:hypothetical protein
MYRSVIHSSHPESEDDDDSSTEAETSSDESEVNVATRRYDQLMQARDEFTVASQAWIPGSGRVPPAQSLVALRASSGGGARTAATPDVTAVPLEVRANDVRRHIINIDSMFRENPSTSQSSDFTFRLLTPIKNVLRIRITSIEFPNNYKFFTALRRYVTLDITFDGVTRQITIPEGNYEAFDMQDTLQSLLDAKFGTNAITVTWDGIRAIYMFGSTLGPISISLPAARNAHYDREFGYGLAYFLGFSYNGGAPHQSVEDPSGHLLTSNACANFAGDPYVFLKVNDFDCVTQTVGSNDFSALAKIVLRDPKNFMTFDDYASQHIKEVVFQNPRDLSRFHVQVLDPFGELIDLCSAQISFSLEVLEIQNHTLYDTVRDSIMLRYV